MKLLLKDILFFIFAAGTGAVLVPYWILRNNSSALPAAWGIGQYIGLLLVLLGLSITARCAWDFATIGRGTPAPIDAPRVLVVHGFYKYVRNPLYLGVLLVFLGEAVIFESWRLLVYTLVAFFFFHLFVLFYEEPNLRRRFGKSYDSYTRSVRRWIPGRKYETASDR